MSSDEEASEDGSEIKMEWKLSPENGSLFRAVNRRDAPLLQQALRNGADVNCNRGFKKNTTPLMEACFDGYDEIVRILLDAGADARYSSRRDDSSIKHACSVGQLAIVEMLLHHDKDLLEFADNRGTTPLLIAVMQQHFEIVRFLLDRGANVHATTHDGTTALMHACRRRHFGIVRLLLAAGVDVEARNINQQTALHSAAWWRRVEAVRELILEHNAKMFVVNQNGETPFDCIIQWQDHPAVDQFLSIYSIKMTQDHGRLALHAILRTAEYVFINNEEFHPPLKPLLQIHSPLGKLTLNDFRSLLSMLDTNLIRNRDENGKLPVHLACRTNVPVGILSVLVEMDAATLHMADHAGALPLHECCGGVVDDCSVRFLVEQGGVGTLAARTREGALPLHVLCGSNNPSWRTVRYLSQSFPGAVTARTNAGQYPFVIAAGESSTASLSVVYELVRANPDFVIPI